MLAPGQSRRCDSPIAATDRTSGGHTWCVHFPDRTAVEVQLDALATGRLSPEDAADWARPFVVNEGAQPEHVDPVVWSALLNLSGADLQSAPDDFLHSADDYRSWVIEFQRAAGR